MLNASSQSAHCLAALALVVTVAPRRSIALQRLEVFAAAARDRNPGALEAGANLRESSAEADAALGRVLPGISLNGRYARNQYGADISLGALSGPDRTIVLLPEKQWTGVATATVPLVDLPNFQRIAAARTATEGAARRLDATRLEVESAVAQSYYQLFASVALVGASNEALQVSREAWRLAQERYRAGSAAVLEVDRARAEVEQRIQRVASVELQVAVASRAPCSASGVTPDLSSSAELEPDLRPEEPLAEFENQLPAVPAVVTAAHARQSADQLAAAQRLTLAPSMAAYFAESGSNAPGFAGHDWSYQAGVTLTWSFDLTTFADIRKQRRARRRGTRPRAAYLALFGRRHPPTVEYGGGRDRQEPRGTGGTPSRFRGRRTSAHPVCGGKRHAARPAAGATGRVHRGREPHPGRRRARQRASAASPRSSRSLVESTKERTSLP